MGKPKDQVLWQPAQVCGIELALREYKNALTYEQEHVINRKQIRSDLIVIKVNKGVQITKSIGSFFRGHNLFELKGLNDALNIDVLSKLIGEACLYKAQGTTVNSINGDDITTSNSGGNSHGK